MICIKRTRRGIIGFGFGRGALPIHEIAKRTRALLQVPVVLYNEHKRQTVTEHIRDHILEGL